VTRHSRAHRRTATLSMWRYTPVLNVCVQLLLSCLLGLIAAVTGVVKPKDRAALQLFVFHSSLPLLVLRGVVTRVDFYDQTLYPFVGIFLVLRALALLVSLVVVSVQTASCGNTRVHPVQDNARHDEEPTHTKYSKICEIWLGLSWMSTVVIGLPVLTAALRDETLAVKFSLQAAISSFIFQLPGVLVLLETHAEETNETQSRNSREGKNVLRRVCIRLARNPVLWAIVCGIVLSMTHTGTWFNTTRTFQFLINTAQSFGQCVTPIGMFVTGAWIGHRKFPGNTDRVETRSLSRGDGPLFEQGPDSESGPSSETHTSRGTNISIIRVVSIAAVLLGKILVLPFIALWLARILNLSKDETYAATLVASLPVSVAGVVVTERHGAPSALVAAQVMCGIALLLPTTLVWCVVLDV